MGTENPFRARASPISRGKSVGLGGRVHPVSPSPRASSIGLEGAAERSLAESNQGMAISTCGEAPSSSNHLISVQPDTGGSHSDNTVTVVPTGSQFGRLGQILPSSHVCELVHDAASIPAITAIHSSLGLRVISRIVQGHPASTVLNLWIEDRCPDVAGNSVSRVACPIRVYEGQLVKAVRSSVVAQ